VHWFRVYFAEVLCICRPWLRLCRRLMVLPLSPITDIFGVVFFFAIIWLFCFGFLIVFTIVSDAFGMSVIWTILFVIIIFVGISLFLAIMTPLPHRYKHR